MHVISVSHWVNHLFSERGSPMETGHTSEIAEKPIPFYGIGSVTSSTWNEYSASYYTSPCIRYVLIKWKRLICTITLPLT